MGMERLLERQREQETQYADFLASLDSTRTATLRELLTEPSEAIARLNVPWLDGERLISRVESFTKFVSQIAPNKRIRGYGGTVLTFFQATHPEEDREEYDLRCKESWIFSQKFDELPPEYLYLNMNSHFFGELVGEADRRVVPPLGGFSGIMDKRHESEEIPIVGYRVPDYPRLLGVSAETATDYFARSMVHDLGHSVLPPISCKYESLHNISMLHAMGGLDRMPEDPWERVIRGECSDPFFFLEAKKRLAEVCPKNALQKRIREKYRNWYVHRNRVEQHRELWGIEPSMPSVTAREQVQKTIARLTQDGFSTYRG